MEALLTHVRVLLAVVVLIAGGVVASAAFGMPGQTLGASLESGVAGDRIVFVENDLDHGINSFAAAGHDRHPIGCMQECSMNCGPSAGSSCCASAALIGGECEAFDRSSIPAYGIRDAGLRTTGLDPEALFDPPRSHV